MRGGPGNVGRIAALAFVYVVLARLGLSVDTVDGFVTLIWAPSGISIAALLIFGNRLWPGVLVGAIIAYVLSGASVPLAVGMGIGNTAEAVISVWLMMRLPRFNVRLEDVRSVTRFLLAIAVGTMIAATIGVACLRLGGLIGAATSREAWRAWWVGDMLGALTVAPLI